MKTFGAIIIIILLIGGLAYMASKNNTADQTKKENELTENQSTDLKIEDLKIGEGTEAQTGKTVKVNYVGTLANGTKFDSSYDRNEPFEFNLGAGQVIEGWDKGVAGMKVGGKRRLTIPPSMGYGSNAVGPIPANSTLIFEVELLEVK